MYQYFHYDFSKLCFVFPTYVHDQFSCIVLFFSCLSPASISLRQRPSGTNSSQHRQVYYSAAARLNTVGIWEVSPREGAVREGHLQALGLELVRGRLGKEWTELVNMKLLGKWVNDPILRTHEFLWSHYGTSLSRAVSVCLGCSNRRLGGS